MKYAKLMVPQFDEMAEEVRRSGGNPVQAVAIGGDMLAVCIMAAADLMEWHPQMAKAARGNRVPTILAETIKSLSLMLDVPEERVLFLMTDAVRELHRVKKHNEAELNAAAEASEGKKH